MKKFVCCIASSIRRQLTFACLLSCFSAVLLLAQPKTENVFLFGSDAMLTNEYRVSLPGYAELLAGFAQKEIANNDPKQVPTATILEFVREGFDLERDEVAVFASWDRFPYVASKEPGAIFCNSGYMAVVDTELTQRQHGRYDWVLEAAHRIDGYLRELWPRMQSTPQYRDKTSFVIATDHGPGSSDTDAWKKHGKVEGAEYVWVAIAGPDTPKLGELSNTGTVYEKDIAPTIAQLLGSDFRKVAPDCGSPLPIAIIR
jgi:hypothetical protein